jgi:hypothetical protein
MPVQLARVMQGTDLRQLISPKVSSLNLNSREVLFACNTPWSLATIYACGTPTVRSTLPLPVVAVQYHPEATPWWLTAFVEKYPTGS